MQVRSLAWHSGLKDLALLQLLFRSDPWPGNSMCLGVAKKKSEGSQLVAAWGNQNHWVLTHPPFFFFFFFLFWTCP